MPKATALVCIGLAALCAQSAHGQVLSSAQAPPGREAGGMLAGQARVIHPKLAAHLTNQAVVEADDDGSALPVLVAFEAGSARLTVTATRVLDHLGQALIAGPLAGERIRVEGHADALGSPDANRDISERRAMAVAAYLEQNFSIDPSRVAWSGQGSASPSRRVVVIARLTSG